MSASLIIGIVIGYLVCVFINYKQTESLTTRPNNEEKNGMISEVMKHADLFRNAGNLELARNEMPWMDAIVYEDLRRLMSRNKFNKSDIANVLT